MVINDTQLKTDLHMGHIMATKEDFVALELLKIDGKNRREARANVTFMPIVNIERIYKYLKSEREKG